MNFFDFGQGLFQASVLVLSQHNNIAIFFRQEFFELGLFFDQFTYHVLESRIEIVIEIVESFLNDLELCIFLSKEIVVIVDTSLGDLN